MAENEEIQVNFTLENNDNINAQYSLNNNNEIEADFVIEASGTTWGSISGEIENQTDLIELLNTKQDTIEDLDTIRSNADTALQPGDDITKLNNNAGFISGITSEDVTTALGYTPYDSANPNDYQANVIETIKVNNTAQTVTDKAVNITVPTTAAEVGALPDTTTIDDLTTTAQQNALNSGATSTNIGQITTNANDITDIKDLIPNQASDINQLADKNFVNSSISTNTANFIGTFNSVADLEAYSGTVTNNDYAFVISVDSDGNTVYNRYKYTTATTPPSWVFEYALNNSSFTAAQWDAINSGATTTNIGQIATALQPGDNISALVNDSGYLKNLATGGTQAIALGTMASATASGSIAYGYSAGATSTYSMAIGWNAGASNTNTIAIGKDAKATASGAIALGTGAENSTANTFQVKTYELLDLSTGLIPDARISSNIARTTDIPSLSNYVTLDTAQTISNSKAFSSPIVMADNNGLASGTILSNKKVLQRSSGDNTLTLNNTDNKLRLIGSETRPKYSTDGSTWSDMALYSDVPAAQVNSDWNAVSGVAEILNKPSLSTVATSGSYNDLTDKPTIPTVNNATLTIQKNGATVNTFTANASSNVTANITVPTDTNDLTNGAGFLTSGSLKTINSTSIVGSGNIDTTEVFIATYGTTTFSAISTAYSGGKTVFCIKDTTTLFILSACTSTLALFYRFGGTTDVRTVEVDNTDTWSNDSEILATTSNLNSKENTSNKVTSLSNTSTDTQYPSAKCVYTALGNVNKDTMRSTEFIVGTQASATGSWTGVTEDSLLYDGKNISYFLPYAGSGNATLNLTLSGGGTTGAKPVYLSGTTYITTHYGANSCINMTYNSTKGAWYVNADRDNNDVDRLKYGNTILAETAIHANKLICGSSDGYNDIASGVTFDIAYPVFYNTADIEANATGSGNCWYVRPSVNLQNTKASWTGINRSMVYLVGTISNGKWFTIDNDVFTTTRPTTEDGKVYMPVGILYSTYQIAFVSSKDLYAYTNGAFQPYVDKYKYDGQWVDSYSQLANGTTYPTSTDIEYSLSTYLPNDGYKYEVLLSGQVTTGTTSANFLRLFIKSDLITSAVQVCSARTRTSSSVTGSGNLIIPVGSSRKITLPANSAYVGTFSLDAVGYRRIGTNT